MITRLLHGALFLLLFGTLPTLAACSDDGPDNVPTKDEPTVPVPPAGNDDEEKGENTENTDTIPMDTMDRNITLTIHGTSFAVTLEDNEAARAFAARLPLTLDMSELNGNEKFFYLDGSLPTASYRPGTIQTGDLMLYGSSCVVLFYQTFASGYSYTRLGRVTNPEGLAAALGSGDVRVSFTK